MSDRVLTTISDGIAEILINRPEHYNAFDPQTIRAFAETMTAVVKNPHAEAIVIGGAGKAFCAGGDLKAILASEQGAEAALYAMAPIFHLAVVEMRRTPKPVVAAINGVAAGGGFSLALAADFRVMGKSAVLKCAYLSAGLCPDGGGSFMLPRIVGIAKALEIAVFDEPIGSAEALALGLVTKVVDDGLVLQEGRALAVDLMNRSRHAFGWAKRLICDSFSNSLEHHLEIERQGIAACGAHPEGLEGLTAFVQKRAPRFTGTA